MFCATNVFKKSRGFDIFFLDNMFEIFFDD